MTLRCLLLGHRPDPMRLSLAPSPIDPGVYALHGHCARCKAAMTVALIAFGKGFPADPKPTQPSADMASEWPATVQLPVLESMSAIFRHHR